MRDLADSRSGPIRCSIENDCFGDFSIGDLDNSDIITDLSLITSLSLFDTVDIFVFALSWMPLES